MLNNSNRFKATEINRDFGVNSGVRGVHLRLNVSQLKHEFTQIFSAVYQTVQQLWPNIANEKNTLIDKNTFAHIFSLAHQRDSLMSLNMGSLRLERGDVGYPFLKGC